MCFFVWFAKIGFFGYGERIAAGFTNPLFTDHGLVQIYGFVGEKRNRTRSHINSKI